MKLRNKKTGEIGELQITEKHCAVSVGNGTASCGIVIYSSLAELNEEWEDYEEPKTFWYMTAWGDVKEYSQDQFAVKQKVAIGNYFGTREEAEKAVEKLKAWKILKDNGFRFISWGIDLKTIADGKIWFDVGLNTQWNCEQLLEQKSEVKEALNLLFGGEE